MLNTSKDIEFIFCINMCIIYFLAAGVFTTIYAIHKLTMWLISCLV